MKKELTAIILLSMLFCLPIFFFLHQSYPNLMNDYDSNLPIYAYILSFITKFHQLPTVIPVVGSGIPLLGDPLNAFLNPFYSVPLLLFGMNIGLRVSILLCAILSAMTMWYLLREWKISKFLRITGALLYMSAGAFIGQVSSGHIEKFLVYPFVPLLLLFSITDNFSFKNMVFSAGIIAATVYSGDLYNTWFFLLFFFCMRAFYFIKERKPKAVLLSILTIPLFLLFASLKLYPFLTQTLPIMKRFSPINPMQGSVHAFLLPLQFIVPFQINFYDRPFFQRHLGFSFNWYEYYAFITPFPFLFLKQIKLVIKERKIQVLILLICVAAFYLSMAYMYSPFHYVVKLLGNMSYFRVPQRIILPLTSVVVLLLTYCAQTWMKEKRAKVMIRWIMIASLVWTFLVGWKTFYDTFPPHNTYPGESLIARIPHEKGVTVATFVLPSELFLIEQGFGIENYYYGWVPKGAETYNEKDGTRDDFAKLKIQKPTYVIISNVPQKDLIGYGYTLYRKNSTISIWKRSGK